MGPFWSRQRGGPHDTQSSGNAARKCDPHRVLHVGSDALCGARDRCGRLRVSGGHPDQRGHAGLHPEDDGCGSGSLDRGALDFRALRALPRRRDRDPQSGLLRGVLGGGFGTHRGRLRPLHHGGGVGMGLAIHAGQVICVDGTPEMAKRVETVLTNDPAMGILRHADAGYDNAMRNAKDWNVDIPAIDE